MLSPPNAMTDCVFCKIIAHELPCTLVHEDDEIMAFDDIAPSAKTHILIIPKKHISTIIELNESEADEILVGKMVLVARNIAKERGLSGYKLSFNVGKGGGQVVFHIHLHLMSGEG